MHIGTIVRRINPYSVTHDKEKIAKGMFELISKLTLVPGYSIYSAKNDIKSDTSIDSVKEKVKVYALMIGLEIGYKGLALIIYNNIS